MVAKLFFISVVSGALFTFTSSFSIAQDEPDTSGKVLFVEPPKTIEEALEQRAKAEELAAAELQKAEQTYAETAAAADKELAGFLSQLARQAVASGDLPAAAKAWEKVIEVQPDSQDAIEFFRTIGKEPATEEEVDNTKTGQRPNFSSIAGKWQFTWGNTGSQIVINIPRNGVIDGKPLSMKGGRIYWLHPEFEQQHEFIPLKDRIVVLGWTTKLGKSPFADLKTKESVPDFVGYAVRVGR